MPGGSHEKRCLQFSVTARVQSLVRLTIKPCPKMLRRAITKRTQPRTQPRMHSHRTRSRLQQLYLHKLQRPSLRSEFHLRRRSRGCSSETGLMGRLVMGETKAYRQRKRIICKTQIFWYTNFVTQPPARHTSACPLCNPNEIVYNLKPVLICWTAPFAHHCYHLH